VGKRSDELATEFEAAVADLAKEIEGCPDEKWEATTEEGWSVGTLAQHIAGQFPLEMEFIRAGAEGKPLPAYNWDDINGKNDTRAAAEANVTKDDVLQTLRDGAASTAAYLRSLDDSALDNKAPLALANNAEVTTEQLIRGGVLIDHVRGHLKSIQAAGQPVN
jgi:hypothetical protein